MSSHSKMEHFSKPDLLRFTNELKNQTKLSSSSPQTILTDTIRLYTDGTIIYLGNYEKDIKYPSFGGHYYSLVDGSILGDFRTEFKYYISGIVIDPFERAMYIRSEKTIEKHIHLGPSPLWLTGINPEQFDLDNSIKKCNSDPVSIGRFTYSKDLFMLSHLAGYLWIDFPKSHAPYHYEYLVNDPTYIDWIFEAIKNISESVKNGKFSEKWTTQDSLLSMQTYLLLAGISIENHYQLSGMAPLPLRYLTDLRNYLTDTAFSSIRQTIIYVFIITAKRLCPLDLNIANDTLIVCLTTRDPFTTDFALTQMMDNDFFIKFFDSRLVEFFFTKMIANMAKDSNDNGAEWFISKFLSELMYGMNKVFSKAGNISESDKKLLDSYIKFSTILLEQMMVCDNPDPKFILLFRKWMSLSQPFIKFSYISKLFMSYLQPLFVTMTSKLKVNLPNNLNEFNQNFVVLLEVYFLYIQLISSLLFGGEEISLVKDFTWLIHSALKKNISPETINNLYPKIF
ncbi:hypothetical protein TVAG_364250 [Trichomonas vaginalis G3]|uniref:Uncharacterized protein n=1 Tax=Trichomonas vaginalis (strain ATCC PRA-98 / G3) TaxID=412133 RepID=A2E9D7_TRIV3|nr:guanyl-nucleotide exchange factor protein [Trichomonas vaginalis G3]EAY10701.1 hypothetical protein TVAG_364250 [Trichomonas vaginalis G3]KAI5538594.1 guanyl-nucleotide exchange factor protein [Trichomonas vaginalis G3]|eukprot:XP_001322924.1 hypothetical protein [Trichomonas vaginalis G3]